MTTITRRASAEALGTFFLVLAGVGTAVFAGPYVGTLGIAIAFGLGMITMVYALGPISGAHLNPAVSVGLLAAGRIDVVDMIVYIAAQVVGALLAAAVILAIAKGSPLFIATPNSLAANGYGLHSPAGYELGACLLAECLLTFFFVLVVLGSTSRRAPAPLAGIAIGLCLTAVHLIGIPITNTSVNPARSTGPALIVGGWALRQLWFFWLAPLFGGAIAGVTSRLLGIDRPAVSPPIDELEAAPQRPVAAVHR
jgi:aquaporin Z